MKKRLYLAAACCAALGAYAQVTSPAAEGYIARAAAMYADDNYTGCIDQLDNVDPAVLAPDEAMRAKYYRAAATVHTDKAAAALLLREFMAEYPASDLIDEAIMAYGDCYYGSDYAKAIEIYSKVNPDGLTPAERDDLYYRLAYSNMKLGKYNRANHFLVQLAKSPEYAEPSRFYRGYIAYVNGDYEAAEAIFKASNTSKAPGDMADYYLSQIYYSRGDYANALRTAKNLIGRKDIEPEFTAEAYRVAGEASYARGEDSQAVTYIKKYVSMTADPKPSALYILGLDYYNHGDYTRAIDYLKPATEKADAMGQSAYLYMGQAYMHRGDYSDAAMAFNRALNMHYDPAVQETAYYNYAVASMQGGKVPFANSVGIFTDFLKKYPDSRYAPDVQKYIIDSYLTDNNYAAALKSINEMKSPSPATLAAKQRVLYALGVKALGASNYQQALDYLTEARTLDEYDAQVDNEVSLALGETYYGLGKYAEAEACLSKYLQSPTDANRAIALYDLGYAQYAQHKYREAARNLAKIADCQPSLPQMVMADAYNRLGDCYYALTDFSLAEAAYDKSYSVNPAAGDYALFQKALMLGYQRKHQEKIDMLMTLAERFPKSAMLPDAMLETTESYIQLGNNAKAIETYKQLVSKYPNTPQGRQGYLQMALVQLNTGNRSEAINSYKEVIRRYPTSEEAQLAIDQMKRIAATDGTLPEFMAFLNSVKGAPKMDESEIEQLTFETAEREYLTEGNITRLEAFVDEYTESPLRQRALSYLIDGYIDAGDIQSAYEYAEAVISQYPDGPGVPKALFTKAVIEEERNEPDKALATWQILAKKASNADMLIDARMGIMRNARDTGKFDLAIENADAVMTSSGVGADELSEARFSKAISLAGKGDTAQARKLFEENAGNPDDIFSVMSEYQLAENYFNAKQYKQAETWADKVTDASPDFDYWIARGFILLSDIYTAQGDKYKGRQYLEALRDYYQGSEEDIFRMINERLK